jgi:Immunity protein 50
MTDGLPDVSFHDAEVLAVRLDRDGPTLDLKVEVAAQLPNARVVQLRFREVSNLEIRGLNEQNVLFDLRVERGTDDRYDVELQSSYGLSGSFGCTSITTWQSEVGDRP